MSASATDEAFERRRLASDPRRATEGDLDAVVECLTAAFREDPVMAWLGRRDSHRDAGRRNMFRFLTRELGLAGRQLWTSSDYSCAALWVPPERANLKQSFWQELALLPTIVSYTGLTGLGRVDAFRKVADKHHPKDRPHAYLMVLGVAPQFQGQGLGSALLDATLKDVDSKRLPAYLESSSAKNVPLYRRHGFEVISEFKPRDDGPPVWGMWRQAKPD
jgi:ribosomal protein S18 acetylase RimI-like enzyme